MPLLFHPLRFAFIAHQPIHFPPGKSANVLRGAFGSIFRKIACLPTCADSSACRIRQTCPYAQMFEPLAPTGFPSGLDNLPRPFVFRAWHLDGLAIPSGGTFYFDLNLFEMETRAIEYLVQAFAELARQGIGPNRSRVELTSVSQLGFEGQPAAELLKGKEWTTLRPAPLKLHLNPPPEPVTYLTLRFVTPTELKAAGGLTATPEFGILAARLRDRISTLSHFYGTGPLDIDFKAFGERATRIQMLHAHIRHIEIDRKSTRTGQTHSIGGFVGEAGYQGDLTEFVPYLKAAAWTGVGRQTVWGKGELQVVLQPVSESTEFQKRHVSDKQETAYLRQPE